MSTDDIRQTAPHSIEAEQAVLGGLMLDATAIDRLPRGLVAEAFYRADHRKIFRACCEIAERGEVVDVVTVFEHLRTKGFESDDESRSLFTYLNELAQNTPGAGNICRYAETVVDRAVLRALITVGLGIADMAFNPAGRDTKAVVDEAAAKIMAIASQRVTKEPRQINDAMRDHLSLLERRADKSEDTRRIATGFADIDELLMGGMVPGQLIVIAGRPSHGKSALALNIAENTSIEGWKTLMLSLEMSETELMDRVMAAWGRVNMRNLMDGPEQDSDWSALTVAAQKASGSALWIDDEAGLTLLAVRNKARSHKRRFGLDVLVVDYLQLIVGAPSEKDIERISRISVGLKTLAKELGIVVIALSQLNRNGAGKSTPSLADLRGSGSIEQDADIVAFVYREEADDPSTNFKNYADVTIAKIRQGRTGRVGLAYHGQHARFDNYVGALPDYSARQVRRGME